MAQAVSLNRSRVAIGTVAVAGLELAWVYTFLYAAGRGLQVPVPIPSVLLVYAISFGLGLGLRAAGRSPLTIKVASWAVWPLATLLLLMALLYPGAGSADGSLGATLLRAFDGIAAEVEAAMFITAAATFLWWLGCRLATSRMTYELVVTEFQLGLGALAGSVLIGYLAHVNQPAAAPIAVFYVGLGLMGAAATRVNDAGGYMFSQQSGSWWGMLLVSVGLVLMLGLFAGVLFTPELMHFVAQGIRALWGLVERLLDALAGLFPSSPPDPQPPLLPEAIPTPDEGEGFSWGLPEGWVRPSRIVYGIFVGGLALLAIWRVVSELFRWLQRKAGRGRAEIEPLAGALRLDLAKLFRRLLAWMARLLTMAGSGRHRPDDSDENSSVRRLYIDMLRWGAKSGFPRGLSQTPFEYQQVLVGALPAHQADVSFVTESYVRAKYGAEPPSETELRELKEIRRRLKRGVTPTTGNGPAGSRKNRTRGNGHT